MTMLTANLMLLGLSSLPELQAFTFHQIPIRTFSSCSSASEISRCQEWYRHRNKSHRIDSCLQAEKYGRGSEIWPECNVEDGGVSLNDSFPSGWVPDVETETEALKLEGLPLSVELDNQEVPLSLVFQMVSRQNKITTIAGLFVLCRGLIRPSDLLFVIAFSGYIAILTKAKLLGRVPPQGHVPELVRNPLGIMLTRSRSYRQWLQLGAGIGIYAPILIIIKNLLYNNPNAARAAGRPMFLLCCQVVTEGLMRMRKVPLPLRILVPVAYNTVRIGLIWEHWLMLSFNIGYANRFLASTNMIYWTLNLFGFLLPVATLRYLRAHFFCIEAEEVVVRPGSEDGVGLLTNVVSPTL